jgi:hypothetical protein
MKPPILLGLGLALACLLGSGGWAEAQSYNGYGDTGGYNHSRKQECCDAAIADAQYDSERACQRTGGFADPPKRGVTYGKCKWKTRQDAKRRTHYWCTATASLRCRR